MAATRSGCMCLCTNIISNLQENKCRSCDTLKAELHEAQQDIPTYKESIKILLEEQSSQPKQMKPDGPWNKEGSFRSIPRRDSTKASPQVGIRRSNHGQSIPTANKFEVLTNLKDPSDTMSSTSASIESDITLRNFEKKDQKMNQMKTQEPSNLRKRRPRIVLIGDSHARNCTTDLQHNLGVNRKS